MAKFKTRAMLKAAALLIPLALLTSCSVEIGTAVYHDHYPYHYPYPYPYAYGYSTFAIPFDHNHH